MLASHFIKKKSKASKQSSATQCMDEEHVHADSSDRDSQDFAFNFTPCETNKGNGFSFDFALDPSKASRNRKRRERKKIHRKLKKEQELALKKEEENKATYDDSEGDSLEDHMMAMHSFIESVEELKESEYSTDNVPELERNQIKEIKNHIAPPPGFQCQNNDDDRFRCRSETESGIINPSKKTLNNKEVGSQINVKGGSTVGLRVSASRRTPGKRQKSKKPMSTQQKARIQVMKDKNVVNMKRKVESTIKFNSADKGKAMVNRGSVAVHKEKNRFPSKQVAESEKNEVNAFSFGFNFNNILSDLS